MTQHDVIMEECHKLFRPLRGSG